MALVVPHAGLPAVKFASGVLQTGTLPKKAQVHRGAKNRAGPWTEPTTRKS